MKKSNIYTILVAVFVACLVLANIVAGRLFSIGDNITMPSAVFVFPITYIVSDIISEIYGAKKARVAIFTAFAMNLFAVGLFSLMKILPSPVWAVDLNNAYSTALGTTLRVLGASLVAFLVGSLLNSYVLVKMRDKGNNPFAVRAILSTVFGEFADSIIFITIAFIGVMPITTLLIMIALQASLKVVYEAAVLPLTNFLVNKMKKLPE